MGHLRDNGFDVEIVDVPDVTPVKHEHGIASNLWSCHTAVVGDYVFEGHVPASAVMRFLEEGSDLAGLSVPGMPAGSPGMESSRPVAYDVIAFGTDGSTRIYESIRP